jgi:hypothetical protein
LVIFCLYVVILDLEPEKWDLKLTDEFIDKLAPLVGSQSLEFLLELDMTFQDWEQIKHKQSERDLVQLNCDILEAWKQNCYKSSLYKLAMFSVKKENLTFSQTMYFQLF